MAKNSDPRAFLASPASTSGSVVPSRRATVPGAILQKAAVADLEPPPSTESLSVGLWPPVDEYLDEPDENSRWERIGGMKKEAFPATKDHGDPHFTLDSLVNAHLAEGWVGSVDLKTRVDKKNEYASDTCVRREGADEAGKRHLEELVFEVVHKRSKSETDKRARGFALRGVRRQIGIFVRAQAVREWLPSQNDWGDPLDSDGSLEDPCLAVPLPLAALFDPRLAQAAISQALEKKGDPGILKMKKASENRGEKRGEKRGQKQERARSVLTVLEARGFVCSNELREQIHTTIDMATLEHLLRQAASISSLDQMFEN